MQVARVYGAKFTGPTNLNTAAIEDIIEIGRDLIAVKESLPHGAFLPWIEAEFGMSDMTAKRFMQVAKVYGAKSNMVFDLQPTALYELAAPKTPLEVREEIEKMIAAGEVVTKATVEELRNKIVGLEKAKAYDQPAPCRCRRGLHCCSSQGHQGSSRAGAGGGSLWSSEKVFRWRRLSADSCRHRPHPQRHPRSPPVPRRRSRRSLRHAAHSERNRGARRRIDSVDQA